MLLVISQPKLGWGQLISHEGRAKLATGSSLKNSSLIGSAHERRSSQGCQRNAEPTPVSLQRTHLRHGISLQQQQDRPFCLCLVMHSAFECVYFILATRAACWISKCLDFIMYKVLPLIRGVLRKKCRSCPKYEIHLGTNWKILSSMWGPNPTGQLKGNQQWKGGSWER